MFVFVPSVVIAVFVLSPQSSAGYQNCIKADWSDSFERPGLSSCPAKHFITGLERSSARHPFVDFITNLDGASCCQSDRTYRSQDDHCVKAKWGRRFERINTWNTCPDGYFLSGLERSQNESGGQHEFLNQQRPNRDLSDVKHGHCCKPKNSSMRYGDCFTIDVKRLFGYDQNGMASCGRHGYYITGLYKSDCRMLHCVKQFMCCSMRNDSIAIEDPDFLIASPQVYRAGRKAKLRINILGGRTCNVEVRLYKRHSVVGRERVVISDKPGELELQVPTFTQGDLELEATVCGVKTKRKKVRVETLKRRIFIQTDKPIYKPGQKVLMRIISVDSDLKPAANQISSVTVEEASGFKIMQWENVILQDGIASLSLQLSKEPVLGKWKIIAASEEVSTTEEIEVAKYVLPKFEVTVKPPIYLALDQDEDITTSICASPKQLSHHHANFQRTFPALSRCGDVISYTYGKDAKGVLTAKICLKSNYMKTLSPGDAVCHDIAKNITGCTEITLTRNELKFSRVHRYNYHSKHLFVNASVTETLTGVTISEEAFSKTMVKTSRKIEFRDTLREFKPGLPFTYKIIVSHLDGRPVTDGKVRVEISRGLFYYHGRKKFYFVNFPVKNGLVSDTVTDMPPNSNVLQLKATYFLPGGGHLVARHKSKAWYSPSLNYIQLSKTKQSPAKVNKEASLRVHYTVRDDMERDVDFHYKVLCKGNMVLSGVHSRHHDFSCKNSSLNSSTPVTLPPATKSSDQWSRGPPLKNIPKALVKNFEIKFLVTQEMVPTCRILVYYVRTDRETVADSIVLDVEDRLENQVSVNFKESQEKPGQKTTLILKARPGSRVAIAALDKSVLLLRDGNDITKSQIMKILGSLDVGKTAVFDDGCGLWSRKRHAADGSVAFNTAGVLFLSNLNIATQSCDGDAVGTYYEDSDTLVTTPPPTRYYPFWYGWETKRRRIFLKLMPGPSGLRSSTYIDFAIAAPLSEVPATAIFVPRSTEAMTLPTGAPPGEAPPRRQKPKAVRVRSNFPETWLWTDVKLNDTTGVHVMEVQVPDTITTWVANGFAMSSAFGMGVSNRDSIRAFQPFFVQITLPYSVVRGEELPVTVTVFNYMSGCVPIKLELNHRSTDYKVTSFHISKLCVCGNDGKSVKFNIIPLKLGRIPLLVKAHTSAAKLCPSTITAAADSLVRKLLVEPEGIEQEYTKGSFFCPKDLENYGEMFELVLPDNIVPGSVFSRISVIGDIMGPALSNLDGLLAMPYGCGEQNMAKFAPNIYIMDYLTNTNQLTEEVKKEALHYMKSGYQRELTYKRKSGSYSAFGNSDSQGSMMLTAFVVRSFARARKYIFVDDKQIEHSISWFASKQMWSGCFQKYGRVFDRSLQGGVNSELTITAYVTVALLEAGKDPKSGMVSAALSCIVQRLDTIKDSYTTALVAYSLALAKHVKAAEMMKRLENKAVSKGDEMYWSASYDNAVPTTPPPYWWYYSPPSADVEMTGYALMAVLKHVPFSRNVARIVKWLSKQRNSYGGFSSTQDTCVALQALSEVAEKFYDGNASTNLGVSLRMENLFSHNFTITNQNRLILQRVEVPGTLYPNKLEIAAKGTGCALLQATVKYNIPEPKEVPAFKINVAVRRRRAVVEEEESACYPLQLKISARWLKEGASNMAIVDVKLPTGFTAVKESLERKLNDVQQQTTGKSYGTASDGNNDRHSSSTNFKRYDIEGQHVMLYFDEIKDLDFSIDIRQSTLVKKLKPAVVKVYDYYDPEKQAKVMYEITEKDCYGDKIKECPKCISLDNIKVLFKKNISCSSYLMRAKSKNGMIKVKKAYLKADWRQNSKYVPYEIPEFCPCEEIYNGAASLMFGENDYFRRSGDETSILLNSDTTIARWTAKKMKKAFQKKMRRLYWKCGRRG